MRADGVGTAGVGKLEFGADLRAATALATSTAMPSPRTPLESMVAKAESLYSLPAVAMEVVRLTDSQRVDTRALKECIERDPALVAKLLKVVNSSLFGLSGRVENLTQALALLGIKPLKLLVLGFSLPEKLFSGLNAEQLRGYWRAALTRAVAARQLVETKWNGPGDDAFLVALLHDIGKLVLLQQLGDPYARFLEQVHSEQGQLTELERRSLGFDHRQLTVELLRKWRLPEMYATAVRDAPIKSNTSEAYDPATSLPQVMVLSNLLVHLVGEHQLQVLPELLECGQVYCDLTNDDLSRLVAEIDPQVAQLAEVLDVDLTDTEAYTEILSQAHQQLARVGEEVAGALLRSEDELCDEVLAESQELQRAMSNFTARSVEPPTVAEAGARADAPQASTRGPRGRTTTESASTDQRQRLTEAVSRAAMECRNDRVALSLVCLEVASDGEELSTDAAEVLQRALQIMATEYELSTTQLFRLAPANVALVLSGFERHEAVELAQWFSSLITHDAGSLPLALKGGVASISAIPKSYDASGLLAAAERCLSAALSSGGGSIKSIEVY